MKQIKSNLVSWLLSAVLVLVTRQAPTLCSVYCPVNACDFSGNYNNCQSCDLKLALNSSMVPNCQPQAAAGYVFEADSRSGTMSYTTSVGTMVGSCGSVTSMYSLDTNFTITYSGITRPYQKPILMVGVVTMGTSFPTGCTLTLRFMNTLTSQNTQVSSPDYSVPGTCGSTTERYFRFKQTYTSYSTANTTLVWKLFMTGIFGASTDARFGITQMLLIVQSCYQRCKTCMNNVPYTCYSCTESGAMQSFLISALNSCVPAASCPSGTYAQVSNHTCNSCGVTNCQTCTTVNQCTLCVNPYLLYSPTPPTATCVSSCPAGYFDAGSTPLSCTQCDGKCSACSSLTVCSACTSSGANTSFLLGTSCVAAASCPTNTFANTLTNVCQACNASCATCSGNKNNCTSCSGTLYFLSNVCYTNCPGANYQGAGNLCTACNAKCIACDISSTNCTACTTSGADEAFFIAATFQCVAAASCPTNTFADGVTHECTACNTSCASCQGTANNCTACAGLLYYLSNVCYSNCPNPYYQPASPKNCTRCDLKCDACDVTATNCTACTTSGANQAYLVAATFQCVVSTACPAGTYAQTITHVCTLCTSPCSTCSNTGTNCTSCIATHYLLNNLCYTNCPGANYQGAGNLCTACNAKCIACDISSTNCTACTTSGADEAFFIAATFQCVTSTACPSDSYPDSASHTCLACNTSCGTCQGNLNNCTSCVGGLYYLTNVCYSDCPDRYYESAPALKQCLSCNAKCYRCDVTATNCSACTVSGANEAFRVNSTNSCVVASSCPAGSFPSTASHYCEACNGSCSTCVTTADTCTACTNPLFLLNNICYVTCPVLYFGQSGVCVACHNLCNTCNGSLVSQCFSCNTAAPNQAFWMAANYTCYTNCPVGYYNDISDHKCKKCSAACTQCTGNPGPCQACNGTTHYFLNDTCINPCPNGMYAATVTNYTYKFCTPCVIECWTCWAGNDASCGVCNNDLMLKKSGSYCRPNCMPGWGDTSSYQTCVQCNSRCVSCFQSGTNCSSCKPGNYFIMTDFVYGTGNCYNPCPPGYFQNTTSKLCDTCQSPCLNCSKLSTNCTACIATHYMLNFTCYSVCPDGFFINGTACSPCNDQCLICSDAPDNCSVCDPTPPAHYHYAHQCLTTCPPGTYPQMLATGNCSACDSSCLQCTGNPSPCSSCASGFFFYQNQCTTDCVEPGYVEDTVTASCRQCEQVCVRLQMTMAFASLVDDAIVVTLTFSEDLDWGTFDKAAFQYFQFSNPMFTIEMFNVEYQVVSDNSYKITLTPRQYIFMYNLGVKVITTAIPQPNLQAANLRPFHASVYGQNLSLTWSYIKAPTNGQNQKQIMLEIMDVAESVQEFLNRSGVREIAQTGVLAWVLPGVQITSSIILVNGIIPQHMYEGLRVMASFIYFQVPSWEKNAENSRYIFSETAKGLVEQTISEITQSESVAARRTLQAEVNLPPEWRFKRTGFTTFFILDVYMQIIMLVVAWVLLLLFVKVFYRKSFTHKNVGRVFLFFHKVHQISLMYISIGIVLEWMYFRNQQEEGYKWGSFAFCLFMLGYYLAYELYIYYDLFQYPEAHINTRSYLVYAAKYGYFLSKIRYKEYEISAGWSPRVWFRPYNYHILSFYKKFMMMICLPIFHEQPYTQTICLIFLQVLQILRFYFTWPFASRLRNIFRMFLQFTLLTIFVLVLASQYLSYQLMLNNQEQIADTAKWFNLLGWLALVMVLVYNLSILVLMVVDLIRMCVGGDVLSQMDQARQQYYWEKVKRYEDQNEDININIISRWVKLGNLRELDDVHEESKYVTIKIEKMKIERSEKFFLVHITHVNDLRIKKEGFIYEENCRRLKIKDKMRKIMQVSEQNHKQFYRLLAKIYKEYQIQKQFAKAKTEQIHQPSYQKPRLRQTREVVIESYLKINLDEYPDGGRVFFYRNMIKHVISLYLNDKKVWKIKTKQAMSDVPVDRKILESDMYAKQIQQLEEEDSASSSEERKFSK